MPKLFKNRKLITDNKANKFLKDPRFIARLAKLKSIPVIYKYDVPYLCGYSKDAKTIYFDKHLKYKMRGHDLTPFLKIHEYTEKALLDIFGMDYQQAHHIATHQERKAVEEAGIKWSEYDEFLKPQIKEVWHEDLKLVPPDLDLEPYKDEKDKKVLRPLMAKEKSEKKSLKKSLNETKISLEYHHELNPVLWNGARLKPEVRDKLLEFGYAWAKFAKIPDAIILDIIMTGGNANYNYTSKSDIDVHLVIDRNALGTNREFVDEYLQDKKVLWTLTHKIKILGYSLEPYAQDNADRYPANQGVYSLKRSRWIQFPNKGDYNWKDDPGLKRKVMFYKKLIDQVIKDKMDIGAVKDLKDKIKTMRAASIAKGGEFSFENLVFKELRNRGYLDRINRYEQGLKDKALSL
jgi:hypothetical protein